MEDRHPLPHSLPRLDADVYRCPGESYTIDRAVHLGRLASFYPACRSCIHRHETHTLSPLELAQWSEIERRGDQQPRFAAESLGASSLNEMPPAVVRQFAVALGIALWRDRGDRPGPPAALVGADGHWGAAELVSAACEALQWAGCRAIDVGAVTSAALAAATGRLRTDAALWVGNASGEPHAIDLKLWGPGGIPWSSPGHLDPVHEIYQSKVDRPKRRGGGLERAGVDDHYLATFFPLFHALRPLRLVVDTTCEPVVRYLDKLVSQAACEVLRPGHVMVRPRCSDAAGATAGLPSSEISAGGQATRGTRHSRPVHAPAGLTSATDGAKPFRERRLAAVGRQVLATDAHFGLWIDGDAEACHLVDQCGASVDSQRLLVLLALTVCRQRPQATLVLERETRGEHDSALARLGARVIRTDSTRQAMCEVMHQHAAVLGGGPSGRFWFSGSPAAPDALLTISLLLTILSESDRPLTDVLDAV
jgi:phosphomannomutase